MRSIFNLPELALAEGRGGGRKGEGGREGWREEGRGKRERGRRAGKRRPIIYTSPAALTTLVM